jgi:pimeloyl-ACP methyl ester carboxylesterase
MTRSRSMVADPIVSETRTIPADIAGVQLQLINKRPGNIAHFAPERTVVLIHGATFSSASLFDAPVNGASFMDALAQAGYDAWAVDARGYGGSTRPPEMSVPAEGAAPLTPARTALRDLGSAVDFVRHHRGVARVGVLGMSWGATVAGAYASQAGGKVEKLVLVTPLWLSKVPRRIDPGGPLGAYRTVDPRAYEAAWRVAAPEHERQALIPEGWFDVWLKATLATDSGSPVPGTIRAPSGAVQDVREHWSLDNPLYDPAAITCPVLLVCAEWDVDVPIEMSHDLFVRLTGAPSKRLLVIGQGTHMLLMEKNRQQAFNAVTAFLNEQRNSTYGGGPPIGA